MLALIISNISIANSSCYVAEDLEGYSSRDRNNFKLEEDGLSKQTFNININGEQSSISPSDMKCMQAGLNSLLCLDVKSKGQVVIETWIVYPAQEKVIYTKAVNGYQAFNGANMFIGNLKGKCN